MKVLKLLLFTVLVVLLFFGAYWLVVRPSGVGGSDTSASGLRQMCIERIKAYGDSIAVCGWDDDYLTTAQVIVNAHRGDMPQSDVEQLESTLQSVFIAKIDSLIHSCYGGSMSDGYIAPGSKLDRAYAGLEVLGNSYPTIKTSQRWFDLNSLKKAHNDIYAFGKRDFRQRSRIGIYTGWNGDTPYISINNVLNFKRYAAGVHTQLNELSTRRSRFPELTSSPWTSRALDKNDVDSRLASARSEYISSEQNAVKRYIGSIMSDLHNHFNDKERLSPENASTVINRLTAIETYLGENDIYVSGFDAVKSQIRRIYITQ